MEKFLDLNEPLKESADIVCNFAKELCGHGVMADDCKWYHSVWQYLRLMNMVSTPTWHNDFYKHNLIEAIQNKNTVNILISGTADYSMLAYVIDAIKTVGCTANIDVVDTCKTPLFACEWYAKRENVKINTFNQDILKHNKNGFYDVICTDAFLTRFSPQDAQKVVQKWNHYLKTDGCVVTTVRIYESKKTTSLNLQQKYVEEFTKRAIERSKNLQDVIQFSPNEIGEMAKEYAVKMKSNSLGNKEEILTLFNDFDYKSQVGVVVGEFSETKYLEIVAKKK